MHLQFRQVDTLPRLAWSAELRRGESAARIYHGPWVEVRGEWFVEGAWNGPFEAGNLHRADLLLGSGGRIDGGEFLVATPTSFLHPVYSLKTGDRLVLSNSLAFLLARVDDDLDPAYAYYIHDLARIRSRGLRKCRNWIHTRDGHRVHLHMFVNIRISPDLEMRFEAKPEAREPTDFSEYAELFDEAMGDIFANADAEGRHRRYRAVTTISTGYDSAAAAAVASRHGCQEAVTLVKPEGDDRFPDDGGTHIAERLGMKTTEYSPVAFLDLPGIPDAEFCACPNGAAVALAAMEDQLVGSVLLTGGAGDQWGLLRVWHPPKMQFIMKASWTTLVGCSHSEFRLRTGFLIFPVGYVCAHHHRKLWHIGRSEEMKPWSIGGPYDRPVARRIIEEAGIPRDWFGQVKAGILNHMFHQLGLSAAGEEDFDKFYETVRRPVSSISRFYFEVMHWLYMRNKELVKWMNKLGDLLELQTVFTPIVPRRYQERVSKYHFTFQWGIRRIKERYGIPDAGGSSR